MIRKRWSSHIRWTDKRPMKRRNFIFCLPSNKEKHYREERNKSDYERIQIIKNTATFKNKIKKQMNRMSKRFNISLGERKCKF